MYQLIYTTKAKKSLNELKIQGRTDKAVKIKQTLDKLSENPRHPGLHTHKNNTFAGRSKEEVFQSYVENKTPGAFRVFWFYGPDKNEITIVAITPHP